MKSIKTQVKITLGIFSDKDPGQMFVMLRSDPNLY